jgi:hypothetical protein
LLLVVSAFSPLLFLPQLFNFKWFERGCLVSVLVGFGFSRISGAYSFYCCE